MGVLALIWACTNYTGKILIKCQEVNKIRSAQELDVLPTDPTLMTVSEELSVTNTAGVDQSEGVTNHQEKASDQEKGIVGKLLSSYEDIGEAAFGPEGRQFITTVCNSQFSTACEYSHSIL